jgi:hypothetical protein
MRPKPEPIIRDHYWLRTVARLFQAFAIIIVSIDLVLLTLAFASIFNGPENNMEITNAEVTGFFSSIGASIILCGLAGLIELGIEIGQDQARAANAAELSAWYIEKANQLESESSETEQIISADPSS